MKNHSKRALRRHHRERLKRKRASYWWGENDSRKLGILASTPCVCSCWMCGSARKYYKMTGEGRLTIQERKFYQESIAERLATE